jgi:hypothetical protein
MANFREDGRTSSLKFTQVVKMPRRKSKRNTRTSIEWTYGDVIVLFHVLHETYQKKYFLPDRTINEVLHQQLRVVFFIYNCYVCFNGNKLTRFFDTSPPKLSDYLAR